ncbi:MAG TPA: FkbM family methyltransferase, partial [Pelotomaculum sp.]|nr:FkbM family methyltransferase [Pelotomaculum sp.]
REHLESEIFKVSEDLYCYKNFLLPINHFEPSVFYYKHGLNLLQTLDKVR